MQPSDQASRRPSVSMPCSPSATRGRSEGHFPGDIDPTAARKNSIHTLPQPVTSAGSQEQDTSRWPHSTRLPTTRGDPTPPVPTKLVSSYRQKPTMTDLEITYDIFNYILEWDDAEKSFAFERASISPPITPETLAELDMLRIINNPKLRHDVNFDRDLHFRPNMEGPRGDQKKKSADYYWNALEGEFFMYGRALVERRSAPDEEKVAYWSRVLKVSQRRLPKVFETVRDILKTLVPDYEQDSIVERLDVDLIMQEIANGVCDLLDLSNWLGKVLKAHCAPMRDCEVEEMQAEFRSGVCNGDNKMLVCGLKSLLTVVEAMKLDVANHQIRHMRPLLVEDTINFQRRYNAHRIAVGKIDAKRARQWLQEETEGLILRGDNPTPVEAVSSGMLREVLFNEKQLCPQTFYLDYERLRNMRTEIRRRACYQLCCEVLADLVAPTVAKHELHKKQAELQMRIYGILRHSPYGSRFEDNIENIAIEILQHILILEGRYHEWDGTMLPVIEHSLVLALNPESGPCDKNARDTCERLLPRVIEGVRRHLNMSAVQLQDALVPDLPVQLASTPIGIGAVCTPVGPTRQYDPEDDFVRRMTHVVCLHWQVWGDLVYTASEPGSESASDAITPASISSPTVPIAQAVYAPGKKWLPVGVTVMEVPSGLPTPSPSPAQSPSMGPSSPETASSSRRPQAGIIDPATEQEQEHEHESLDAQQD